MGAVEIGTLRRTAGYDKKRLTGYNPARRYLVYFDIALHRIVHLLGYMSPLPGTGFFWQVNSCRIMSKLFSLHGGSLLKPPYQNTVQGSSKQKETAALIYSKPPFPSVIQESARNPLPVSGFFLSSAVEADVSY